VRTLLSGAKLPAGDLQTDLPQDLHVSTFLLQAGRLLQRRSHELMRSEVRGARSGSDVRGSGSHLCGSDLCSGPGPRSHVCGSDLCTGSGSDLCGSDLCAGSRSHVCGSGSDVCGSGSEMCSAASPGSCPGQVLRSSRSGEVLRYGLREELLQSRSVRSGSLDL